jgi:hypothetical protein
MYCRVLNWMSTDVSEVHAASIRAMTQHASLKRLSAVHPRRFWASYSPPWELEISQRESGSHECSRIFVGSQVNDTGTSEALWRCCVVRKTNFLGIIHLLYLFFLNTRRFGDWSLSPSSGIKRHLLSVRIYGLALSIGPNRVGVPFYLVTETDSSLRNVVCFLNKDRRWIMSKKFVTLTHELL